jgi:hypothetical protein
MCEALSTKGETLEVSGVSLTLLLYVCLHISLVALVRRAG